ncbi:MAG: glutamate synthase large subunit [Lachnospiraceae bacterium]|nr:glutamate synthase large subunit [Lachnospiraceae bacterium]
MGQSLSYDREHDACGIGAVVKIDGVPEYSVMDDALTIVEKLEHRAGKDATGKVGDGVGILLQISHDFFKKAAKEAFDTDLGEAGDYAVGMFFLPQDPLKCTFAKRLLEVIAQKENMEVIGWREVPIHPEILGERAKECMPAIRQCFLKRPADVARGVAFDRRLYVVRREFEQSSEDTYICSLSGRTIVYKGMFLVGQLRRFYEDLQSKEYRTAVALVHSRFSTNTLPSWERAHPYRFLAHNGEINTIRGNSDRMLAREETMHSDLLDTDQDKIYPVISATGSDSAMLDNTLEFLYMNGMDLPLAMMALIPEPWKYNRFMSESKKDFYHYYATVMEPWDGPAAILFTDGELFGATLDRNGLRPSRYYITDDNRLILSSEVGVLDIPPEKIVEKSRLTPGKMLLVDMKQKRIISDEECKESYAARKPYGEWLDAHLVHLKDLEIPNHRVMVHSKEQRERLYKVFGYSYEEVKQYILQAATNGAEMTVSMGHDVPLAPLSDHYPLLYRFFQQQFAQVTNPPIDSLREKIVTDTTVYIGSDGDLLKEQGENCTVLEVNHPILTGVDLMKIKSIRRKGFKTKTISLLYYKHTSLAKAVEQLCLAVDRGVSSGGNIIILSDRGVDENHVPIPALLAVSAVEQHLVRTKKRTAVSLILESGEIRDVHQTACILGFGARAVNPYLAHECIGEMIEEGILDKDRHTAIDDYNHALLAGVVKIAAKMGISTIQSYQSAKIFEAIGLSEDVIEKYFTGVASRVGGIGMKEIEEGIAYRHDHAFDPMGLPTDPTLDSSGFHNLRSGPNKEDHLYSPKIIVLLQQACRTDDYEKFKEYTALVDDDNHPHTLRGLLDLVPQNKPISIDDVEPVSEIVKRFQVGAMSYGSLSMEAHETIAKAMNRLGGRSNTGEGGEASDRFGTERNSAVKQVASGRFGVTGEYLLSAKEIQIKMAQGAKPGEGGNLPAKKVYPWVAKTRCSTPGVQLISPPPHHDIYSIEDLAQLIYDLKNANRDARISVKLVSEAGVGTIASGVAKAGAQVVLISGYDGGTGAAPYSSVHSAGLPWELGVAETHQSLLDSGLRSRVRIETDGKLMTGRDVAIAALLGAEEYGFATAPLVTLGCMMMRVCSKDTCPVGIATQNETLRKRFAGKPEYLINFMTFVAMELREYMASLGFKTVDEMIGRSDCLKKRADFKQPHAGTISFDTILKEAYAHAEKNRFEEADSYDFGLKNTLDEKQLLPWFEKAKKEKKDCSEIKLEVTSTDRTFGTILGSEILKTYGDKIKDLPQDRFKITCEGGGGQSFGAFIPRSLTIRLIGDANDGFGKGLSGGTLVVKPSEKSRFKASENIIVGNVALYGATSGKAFICGVAGERFCVRNSGATAVAEGCGDHGLEYMTGGRAVILGPTGKNFAAGMSGGIAYVLDRDHSLYRKLNKDMVELEEVTDRYDMEELEGILKEYVAQTDSELAKEILSNFEEELMNFKKIVPRDYHKMIRAIAKYEEQGISREKAELEAFREITEEKVV